MEGTPRTVLLAGLVLLSLGLAGCLGGSGQQPQDTVDDVDDDITADNVDNYTNNSTIEIGEDTEFDPNSDLHEHDFWGGDESVAIVEGQTVRIDWQQWAVQCSLTASCHQAPMRIVDVPIADSAEDPNFVFPGTGSLDVELEWASDGLEDAHDGFDPKVCVTNRGYVPTCEPDDLTTNTTHVYTDNPETWTIDDDGIVNRRTTDPPHAQKSNWRFAVLPCRDTDASGPCSPQQIPNVGMTEFTMTVTIHRAPGNLPVDPPHFAFYGDDDQLAVLDGFPVSQGSFKATHQQWMAEQTQDQERVVWYVGGSQIQQAKAQGLSEQPVIPMTTRDLTVTLEWTSGTSKALELKYRSAADNWQAAWRDPPSDPGSCGDGCLEYTIPVDKGEGDSPYALVTQWEFGVFHASDDPMPMTDYDVTLSIVAHEEGT